MAGTNNILQWNPGGTNQESDSAYSSDSMRSSGAASGQIFPSPTANKLFFQVSTMAAALAGAMANKNYNISDANLANLITALGNILTNNDIAGNLVRFTDFLKGNNANGYWEKSPSGRIIQWGHILTDINGGTLPVTFPTNFTNLSSISIVCTSVTIDRVAYVVGSVTLSGFTIGNNGSGATTYWQAMGY